MSTQGAVALVETTRRLLMDGSRLYGDGPEATALAEAAERLDEPLRVAVAGRVKAGKSTLLNALVGEPLAPTDAGECTRIVTWYRNGTSYQATIHTRDGSTAAATVRRQDGGVEFDLGPVAADDIERLVVEWPAAPLQRLTLVDTPGIASARTEISARTTRFLLPGEEDEPTTPADAVIYLLRHLHSADASFLEAFTEQSLTRATPANAIGVLSRADEVGGGRLDAMTTARRVAGRYRDDPQVRRLCQTVIAVAGLVAETAVTLRQDEFAQLRAIADGDRDEVEAALRSASAALTAPDAQLGGLGPDARRRLLERFGIWGLRLSVALVRTERAPSAPRLAAELVERSGLADLREGLASQLGARAEALKARGALVLLRRTLTHRPHPDAKALLTQVERTVASAHVLEELRLLPALRSETLGLRRELIPEAERLLGADGPTAAARLGLDDDADPATIAAEVTRVVQRWQVVAAHPLSSPAVAHAARVLARSAEGLASGAAHDDPWGRAISLSER
jgi:hypothetical protein